MTAGALVLIAVMVILFMAVVAGLAALAIKVGTATMHSFFAEMRKMNAGHQAEREASQEAYAKFLELQEQREQVLAQADQEWVSKPESQVAYDDDLDWGSHDG